MKKMSFVLTLTVLAAMFLAACGGANGTFTPGVGGTEMPVPGTGLETTTGGSSLDGTPAVDETMDSTLGADSTETVVGESTGTLEAGTGMGSGQFALLSNLFKMQVNGKDGSSIGSIAGVVVNRPIPATGSGLGTDNGSGMSTTETPAADTTLEAVTPTVSAGSGSTGSIPPVAGPFISYLVINQSEASASPKDTTPVATSDALATPAATSDALATPAETDALATATLSASMDDKDSSSASGKGSEVLIPWAAVSSDMSQSSESTLVQTLTLTVDSMALASAPTFAQTMDSSVAQSGWDTSYTKFWSGQGIQIPVTGASSTMNGSSTVLRSSMQSMSVMDGSGQSFGQVADYVVDLKTGNIKYAVLSNSSTSGSTQGAYYLVPFSQLTWGGSSSSAAFTFNGMGSALSSAPSVTSLEKMDFSNLTEVDTYWQSQTQ